jgi:hypothetical protein
MSSKTIQIDPKLFQVGSSKNKTQKNKSRKRSLNRSEKKTLASVIKPNKAKKELLKLIREKQKRDREKMINEERKNKKEDIAEFSSNFEESMGYIQKVLTQNKKTKTLKQHKQHTKQIEKQHDQPNTQTHIPNQSQSTVQTQTKPQIQSNLNNNMPTLIQQSGMPSHSLVPQNDNKKTHLENGVINNENVKNETHHKINLSSQQQQSDSTIFKPTMPTLANKPDPPYGCLKGGNKPTFKEYNKTMKRSEIMKNVGINNNDKSKLLNNTLDQKLKEKQLQKSIEKNIQPLKKESELSKEIRERREKLRLHQQKAKNENGGGRTRHKSKDIKTRFQKYKVKTIKKTYKLGKYKNKKQIGVLIKNNATRKKVKFETSLLSKTPIPKIKKYLREKNMIKYGSHAPDSLLKKMFTESMLSGDVTNKSNDVLIHNYFAPLEL